MKSGSNLFFAKKVRLHSRLPLQQPMQWDWPVVFGLHWGFFPLTKYDCCAYLGIWTCLHLYSESEFQTQFIALLIWIKNLKFGPCRHFFVGIPYSNMQFSHLFFSFLNSNRQLQTRKLQRDRRTHICFEAQLCSQHRSRYTASKSVWNQAVSLVEHFRQPQENNTNNCDVHKWEIINSIELIP